jgi:hypothetical protein
MRRCVHGLLGVVSVALCAACTAPWAEAGNRASTDPALARCGSNGGHTIAASSAARVYSLHGHVYGCAGRAGRVYRLGSSATCISTRLVGPVTVVGDLAAYGAQSCGIDTGSSQVVVRRLSDDQQILTAGASSLQLGPESYVSVTAVALRADGHVAWIAMGSSIATHRKDVEVHQQDARGAHLLDSGAAVRPQSLKLRGTRLTWIHGRSLRSSTLR